MSDRAIRDQWMSDGTASGFGVLANAWKETVRDAVGDITANRAAAKAVVRRAIARHTNGQAERKRHNQIIIRADKVRTFTLVEGGDVWLAVPGLERRASVSVPLNTAVAPTGTVRLILRDDQVEVHYQIDARSMPSAARPCGDREIGVDKGYTEVLVDSDGVRHGPELGRLLSRESDWLKAKNARRAKLRSVAQKATARGDHAKAARVVRHNLGTVNMNRRLAAWTKGITAEALANVSERRGSVLVMVNAAYTSQVDPQTGAFGVRRGDRLYCSGGVVLCVDHAAAINVLHRVADPDIGLHTPHTEVRRIVRERADRHRISTADPGLQPGTTGGERIVRTNAHQGASIRKQISG
jgi:hypothetical protein